MKQQCYEISGKDTVTNNLRVRVLLIIFLIGYGTIILRAYYLQVYSSDKWARQQNELATREITYIPIRGSICSRDGKELALNITTQSLYIEPKNIPEANRLDFIKQIANYFKQDEASLTKKLQNKKSAIRIKYNLNPAEVALVNRIAHPAVIIKNEPGQGQATQSLYVEPKNIPETNRRTLAKKIAAYFKLDAATLINDFANQQSQILIKYGLSEPELIFARSLTHPAIALKKEFKRSYPKGELASHIIGITGVDANGLEGLEKKYDKYLRGKPSSVKALIDAKKEMIRSPNSYDEIEFVGPTMYLTLDSQIQYHTEKELEFGVKEANAKGGIAIVMDPNSGEILAMANYPDFDPNWYLKYERDERKNRAVNEAYELGSSLKPFTVAAALEEGLVTPEDRFNCHFGVYPYARRVIHDDHPHGMLSVTEILTFSSNIGVCQIADKVKAETLYRYFRQFGFGRLAGIDLPAESSGILPNGKDWQQIDLATYSFGQGFTVTPLQLVAAYSAIANGGTWHRPYIVKQILDKDGKTIKEYKASPLNTRHVLAKENAAKVTAMLETVVTTGTAKKAAMPGFRVAGKTGTAQKVERVKVGKDKNGKDKEIGRYGKGRMSTFVGYLPADNPKLAIIVVIDEPQGCKYGGVVAAPVFKRIAEESLNILQIFPEVATK